MAPNVKEERKYEQPQKQAKRKLQIKGRGLNRDTGTCPDSLIKIRITKLNQLNPLKIT